MQLIKKWIKDLAQQNYYLAKVFWKRGQLRKMQKFDGQPILNYQMGKVGSSTIQASLDALHLNQPIYHVHFLNPNRVREIEKQRRGYFNSDKHGLLLRPWLYEFLFEQVQNNDRFWKLITLVRDPISRNISTFFENLDVSKERNTGRYCISSDYYKFNIELDLDQVDILIEMFFDRLVHERPLRYFDDEIKTVFGIDVFDGTFPTGKGYKIYKGNNANLLLIRLENLNQCAKTAFKEFLDIDNITLIQTNVGSKKAYAQLYREFKRKIRLPKTYVDMMYDSKYSRFFYTNDEIQQFRKRWPLQE